MIGRLNNFAYDIVLTNNDSSLAAGSLLTAIGLDLRAIFREASGEGFGWARSCCNSFWDLTLVTPEAVDQGQKLPHFVSWICFTHTSFLLLGWRGVSGILCEIL